MHVKVSWDVSLTQQAITSCTSEFIHGTQKEIERHRIFHAENVAYPLGKSVCIKLCFYLAKPPFRHQCFSVMIVISNSNWTEWSTIQGAITRVVSKSDGREANLKLRARLLLELYDTRSNY